MGREWSVNLKSILGWLALAFVVWWIIEQPSGAAHVVHNIGTFLTSAAHGLSNFFASIGTSKGKGDKPGTNWGGIIVGGIVGGIIVIACIWAAVDHIRNKK